MVAIFANELGFYLFRSRLINARTASFSSHLVFFCYHIDISVIPIYPRSFILVRFRSRSFTLVRFRSRSFTLVHLFSFVFVLVHLPSFVFVLVHLLSFIYSRSLSFSFIYPRSFILVRFRSRPFILVRFRSRSFILFRFRSRSLHPAFPSSLSRFSAPSFLILSHVSLPLLSVPHHHFAQSTLLQFRSARVHFKLFATHVCYE
jgi:hypothetical protein